MSATYPTKITEKKVVAKNTLMISFERPNNFSFQAGQYIQLAVKNLNYPDPKGSSRTFQFVLLHQIKKPYQWSSERQGADSRKHYLSYPSEKMS